MQSRRPGSLSTNPLIQSLVVGMERQDTLTSIADGPRGSIRGTIVDIKDPEKRGRIKVVFDDMNPEKAQLWGGGQYGKKREGEASKSHWIDVTPPFKGLQPKKIVGMRVNISVTDGQYQYAVAQDMLWDENILTEKTKTPNNSTMTRCPVYEKGEFPPPCEENHGCMVIENNGPMQSDWLCICLKRRGKYIWVRHVDLQHGHAGENDGLQPPDSAGDGEQPVNEQTIWDYAFPTSDRSMAKYSRYGTSPRPNPYGGNATWHAPPK